MTKFDLTKLGQEYVRQVARMRLFVAAFFTIVLTATAYFGIRFGLAGAWTRGNIEASVGLAVITGGLGVVTWLLSPSALSVEVETASLRFEYPGGRVKALDWEDRHFRLVIDHTTGANDAISRGKPVQLAADRRVFQDFLSAAAFRAILREADQHGLNVVERRSPRPGWMRSTISQVSG